MIRISVFYDGKPVSEFEQAKPDKEITIGRAPGCMIRLDEASISRLHALIKFSDNSWILERRASFGTVLLNGTEVENAVLQGGEEVTLGKFVLRVQVEEGGARPKSSGGGRTRVNTLEIDSSDKTKVASGLAIGLLRFEPGTANVSEYTLDKDVSVIGRGSNCDVVILEKRASRKHFEVRRQGLSFFVKDLNSSNGIEVNGKKVDQAELVPGDVIQVCDTKIQFSIESQEFFSKQDQFLPVPMHLQESDASAASEEGFPSYGTPMDGQDMGMGQAATDAAPAAPEAEPPTKSLFVKFKRWYLSLNPIKRYTVILLVPLILGGIIGYDDDKPPPKKVEHKVTLGPDGKPLREYNNLTKAQKASVDKIYADLATAMQNKDFKTVSELAPKILDFVDDYKDTKSYLDIAKTELDKQEKAQEEARRKEQQEALRKEVEAMEEKGKVLYEKALKDKKARPELSSLVQDIYTKDPNNTLAGQWEAGIKAQIVEEKHQQELADQKEALRKKAEDAYDAVVAIFRDESYIKALAEAEKLSDVGYTEKDYLDKVAALKEQIRSKLHSLIDPLLTEAKSQSREGGDLVRAKELYMQVLKIDAANPDAKKGLASIREVLHMRARRLYAEAILAESLSDLNEARDKYVKCEHTAPDDDAYRVRCHNKAARFDAYSTQE